MKLIKIIINETDLITIYNNNNNNNNNKILYMICIYILYVFFFKYHHKKGIKNRVSLHTCFLF
jgi:hypothetical protein